MLRYGLQPDIYGRASQGGVLGRPILECHMNEKRCYWVATLLGCIALTLFVVNMTLAFDNTARKREIGDRQAAISRGAALHELTLKVAETLNEIADKYNDDGICTALRAEGMPVAGKCVLHYKTGTDPHGNASAPH